MEIHINRKKETQVMEKQSRGLNIPPPLALFGTQRCVCAEL